MDDWHRRDGRVTAAGSKGSSRRLVLIATVTPLASIFGSGFLIIVPVLERTLGSWSVFGVAAVCGLAWVAGTAIRHCVKVVEPQAAAGTLDRTTARLDRIADAVIVVAYVISVALYLRILAQYVFHLVGSGSTVGERILACSVVAVIMTIGITRGFQGLDLLERIALIAVLVIVVVIVAVLLIHDVRTLGGGLRIPPGPSVGVGRALLTLGGVVITVQGFETVRYLADQYDAPTRIRSSRIAQLVATAIYLALVVAATPVMGLGTAAGADATLLNITGRVAPFLSVPLVVIAVLSQFSAATADTVAAEGNLRCLTAWMRSTRAYLVSGIGAIVLAATVPTFTIVAVASRAFAAYYAIEAVVAMRTTTAAPRKLGYAALAAVMLAITLFAQPAG